MTRERRLRLNFHLISLYYFFRSFIFAYVIERLFWRSRGISIADTVYIEIIYSVVLVVMEIPTGVWADRWSRKKLIVLGASLTLLASVLILNAYGFMAFAVIIVLSALSGALTSGSVSALLYDGLKELGDTLYFEKYLARIKAIRYGSGLIAALIGAYMASHYNLLIPYQWSVISCLMMTLMAFLLLEPKRTYASDEKMTTKEIITISQKVILHSGFLKYIFIVGSVIGASIVYIEEFWQNYFDAIHINVAYFGLISGLMSIVVIIASLQTEKISNKLKSSFRYKKRIYTLIMFITGISFMGLFGIRHPIGLVFMLIAIYSEALIDTLVLGDLHHQVESDYRATVESVYAMLSNVASIVIGLLFAFASEQFNVFTGFLSIGCLILLVMFLKRLFVRTLSN